jgi:hypothetical protein
MEDSSTREEADLLNQELQLSQHGVSAVDVHLVQRLVDDVESQDTTERGLVTSAFCLSFAGHQHLREGSPFGQHRLHAVGRPPNAMATTAAVREKEHPMIPPRHVDGAFPV